MHLIEALLGSVALAGTTLAANHVVVVGKGGGLTFTPPVTNAAMGDTVTFEFLADHNVIQADEDSPCVPMKGGFFSGPEVGPDDGDFQLTINSTDSMYFYCSYDMHCAYGMVGVINGPMSDYESFEKGAMMVNPNDVETPNGEDPINGEIIKSSSSGSSGSDDDNDNDSGNMSGGGDNDNDSGSGSMSMGSGSGGMGGGNNAGSATGAPLAIAGFAAAAIAFFAL